MTHPHENAIKNMNTAQLIDIIHESRMIYVRENLDIHLHESEIKLLRQVLKHEKPHHKKIRVKKYEKAEKSDLFRLHEKSYLKKYQKLESKGLIEIDLNPDNALLYDCSLTAKGAEILSQIEILELKWLKFLNISDKEVHLLKRLALDSFEISYIHRKNSKFNF